LRILPLSQGIKGSSDPLRVWAAPSLAFLLLAFAASAAARDLKVATWNIEWATLRPAGDPSLPDDVRPKTEADLALLRGYADRLDADVVAMQEVDGPAVAARIFAPDRYALLFIDEDVVQRVGLAMRRGIAVTRNPDLAALDLYPDAPHRLRRGLDVTLDLPGARLRVLAVHLKTGCREDPPERSARPGCAALARQVPALAGWIAQRRAEGAAFLVLGDFNRWMGPGDPVLAALEAAAPLARATEGKSSPCWGWENFIDHILAGGAAWGWMQADTLRVTTYRESGEGWKERLSDHCPVSVRLAMPD